MAPNRAIQEWAWPAAACSGDIPGAVKGCKSHKDRRIQAVDIRFRHPEVDDEDLRCDDADGDDFERLKSKIKEFKTARFKISKHLEVEYSKGFTIRYTIYLLEF